MTHLIDKSALVAEIKARINDIEVAQKAGIIKNREAGIKIALFKSILSLLDTLEVKDADLEHLEQEVKDFCYEYDDRKEKWYELCPNDRKLLYNPTWANFAMSIAKHFFELGISVNNKEHKGE